MTQAALFFIVIALSGVFSLRWAIKLAPLNNEFTLKIGLATLISIGLGAALLQLSLAPFLSVLLAIILSLYIFVPALLSSLARNARYTLASGLSDALFWTPEGREVAKRLLAQVALQHGDAKAARELVTRDASPLFLAQVYALEQDWDALLTLDIPTEGDNSALAYAARIEALLARERIFEAEAELSELKHRFEKNASTAALPQYPAERGAYRRRARSVSYGATTAQRAAGRGRRACALRHCGQGRRGSRKYPYRRAALQTGLPHRAARRAGTL